MSNIGKYEFDFKVVAIDFDGTLIAKGQYPNADVNAANKAMIALTKLYMQNPKIKLVLWSCRDMCSDPKAYHNMMDFCKHYGLYFDEINDNIKEYRDIGVKCRKIIADVYIDDLGIPPNKFIKENLTGGEQYLLNDVYKKMFGECYKEEDDNDIHI